MKGVKVKARFVLLVILLLLGNNGLGRCYKGPDNPQAEVAAREAVKRLGPERGALAIEGKSLDIEGTSLDIKGIRSVEVKNQKEKIKGLSVEVEKVLDDLGAKKVGEKIQVSLSGDVLFDFDKWDVKKAAEKTLYKLVKAIKGLKVKEILIEGHTDSKGSEEYNLALSQRRADAVKAWLIEKGGLKDVKIVTKGYGESKPVAPNTKPDGSDNPKGRAKNRRVEIYVSLFEE